MYAAVLQWRLISITTGTIIGSGQGAHLRVLTTYQYVGVETTATATCRRYWSHWMLGELMSMNTLTRGACAELCDFAQVTSALAALRAAPKI